MNAFLFIMLKSTLCLSVLYGLYMLLKKETSFRFNRLTLLFIMIASLSIPLMQQPLNIHLFTNAPLVTKMTVREAEKVNGAERTEYGEKIVLSPEIAENDAINAAEKTSAMGKEIPILPAIYFVGMMVCLIGTFLSLFRVLWIIIASRKERFGRQKILVSRYRINSFTFAGWIVLSEMDFKQHVNEIVTHENVHRHKAHCVDVGLINVLTILYWFNPLVWMLRKELKSVHEYEADYHTLNQGIDTLKYQLLLIEKTAGASRFAIASSFAQSKIKKRLIMMNMKINPKMRWRTLLFIPMTALLTQAFARPNSAESYSDIRDRSVTTLQTTDNDTEISKLPFDEITSKSTDDAKKDSAHLVADVTRERKKTTIEIHSDSLERIIGTEDGTPDGFIKSQADKDTIREKLTKMENVTIVYNGQEMRLIDALKEMLAFTKKHELKAFYRYCVSFDSNGKWYKCGIWVNLPKIDQKQPEMYYFINDKWWWSWNYDDAAGILSVETLEAD
ncbi:MAG: hypothetical protein LBN11_06975, partial [Tannerella sp.]|nr:hypothetical protein [Tannerella sp.]